MHPPNKALLGFMILVAVCSCAPPALQLQREARDQVRRAQSAKGHSAAQQCQAAAAAAEAEAFRSYPVVSSAAGLARDRMREVCAALPELPPTVLVRKEPLPQVDLAPPSKDLAPPSKDLAAPKDLAQTPEGGVHVG